MQIRKQKYADSGRRLQTKQVQVQLFLQRITDWRQTRTSQTKDCWNFEFIFITRGIEIDFIFFRKTSARWQSASILLSENWNHVTEMCLKLHLWDRKIKARRIIFSTDFFLLNWLATTQAWCKLLYWRQCIVADQTNIHWHTKFLRILAINLKSNGSVSPWRGYSNFYCFPRKTLTIKSSFFMFNIPVKFFFPSFWDENIIQ